MSSPFRRPADDAGEIYLSDGEFEQILGFTKEDFYNLPKWKRDGKKKSSGLF